MKSFDANIELQLIKTICDSPKRSMVLSKIGPEWFGSDSAKEIYSRIIVLVSTGKSVPSSEVMKHDEALTDASRALLGTPVLALNQEADIMGSLEIMNKYRKARIIMNSVVPVIEGLREDNPDIDKYIAQLSDSLETCHSGLNKSEIFSINSADTDKVMEYVETQMSSVQEDFIPTSFREFDKKNGGFRRKQVIVLASIPGGGKSAMALQMAINQYMMGFNVLVVGMEMGNDENLLRVMSSVTKIEHGDINLRKLTEKQKEHIRRSFREFVQNSNNKNRLDFWEPSREIDMVDVGMESKSRGYDIVYIDYIGLLRTYPKMPGWEVLGVHSRQSKLQANNANACIVLLAQKNTEEDSLKYSQAINQNAHVVWMWDNGENERASGIIQVRQTKVRNGEVFPFHLQRDFRTMTFKDYSGPIPSYEQGPSVAPPKMRELRDRV